MNKAFANSLSLLLPFSLKTAALGFINFLIKLKKKNKSGIFNISSGKNYSVQSIYNQIKTILKSDIKPIYGENFDFEAQDTLANIDAAKKIGWAPNTSISSGLKKSIDYIKENVI